VSESKLVSKRRFADILSEFNIPDKDIDRLWEDCSHELPDDEDSEISIRDAAEEYANDQGYLD